MKWFKRFRKVCNGRMFKKDFIKVYNKLYQGNGEVFAYEIFKLYDMDYRNDYIDFKVNKFAGCDNRLDPSPLLLGCH